MLIKEAMRFFRGKTITKMQRGKGGAPAESHEHLRMHAASQRRKGSGNDVLLYFHASYGAREILTAVGWLTERRVPFQSGVLPLGDRTVELLFAALDKSSGFHDRSAFHDYAISADRFHWQTQNSAGPDTPAGRRYLESATNGFFQEFSVLRGQ